MAYDLEEQEQLDEFKAWWKKNGKLVTNAVIAALLVYVAWQGYQYWQNKKATEASDIYQALTLLDAGKVAEMKAQANKLMDGYSSTPYAGRAAVLLAKAEFANKDSKPAKSDLQWAIDHAKEDAIKAIASLQLAGILLEEKDYEAAHKVLDAKIDAGFTGLRDEMKGNVYLAQGKQAEAKQAFESALSNLDAGGALYQFTKQKLESLG
ncbi:MAG TPA: tetratricopeptide repeat protein [Methylophilus sp.]|nr:tetratricopeptide repeat protein [Methylophilus sp.]HQQ33954.1 tetratricopeptide repeat protein [Methylophilus sp.]